MRDDNMQAIQGRPQCGVGVGEGMSTDVCLPIVTGKLGCLSMIFGVSALLAAPFCGIFFGIFCFFVGIVSTGAGFIALVFGPKGKIEAGRTGIVVGKGEFVPWEGVRQIRIDCEADIDIIRFEKYINIEIDFVDVAKSPIMGVISSKGFYRSVSICKLLWMYRRYCPSYKPEDADVVLKRTKKKSARRGGGNAESASALQTKLPPVVNQDFDIRYFLDGPFPLRGYSYYFQREAFWDCLFCGLFSWHRMNLEYRNTITCGIPYYLMWAVFSLGQIVLFVPPLGTLFAMLLWVWPLFCLGLWLHDLICIGIGTFRDGDGRHLTPGGAPEHSCYTTYYDLCWVWAEYGIHRIYLGLKSGYVMLLVSLLAIPVFIVQKLFVLFFKIILIFCTDNEKIQEYLGIVAGPIGGFFVLYVLFSMIFGAGYFALVLAIICVAIYIRVLITALNDRITGFLNRPLKNAAGNLVENSPVRLFRDRAQTNPAIATDDPSEVLDDIFQKSGQKFAKLKANAQSLPSLQMPQPPVPPAPPKAYSCAPPLPSKLLRNEPRAMGISSIFSVILLIAVLCTAGFVCISTDGDLDIMEKQIAALSARQHADQDLHVAQMATHSKLAVALDKRYSATEERVKRSAEEVGKLENSLKSLDEKSQSTKKRISDGTRKLEEIRNSLKRGK